LRSLRARRIVTPVPPVKGFTMTRIRDDHDTPWKEALERYFPEFLAIRYCPSPAAGATLLSPEN